MLYMLCFTLSKGCKWKRSVVWTYKHWYIAQVIFFYGRMKFLQVWNNMRMSKWQNVYFWVNKSCSIWTGFGWWLLPASIVEDSPQPFKFLSCLQALEKFGCVFIWLSTFGQRCCNWPDCCCFVVVISSAIETLRGAVELLNLFLMFFSVYLSYRFFDIHCSVVHCCRPLLPGQLFWFSVC